MDCNSPEHGLSQSHPLSARQNPVSPTHHNQSQQAPQPHTSEHQHTSTPTSSVVAHLHNSTAAAAHVIAASTAAALGATDDLDFRDKSDPKSRKRTFNKYWNTEEGQAKRLRVQSPNLLHARSTSKPRFCKLCCVTINETKNGKSVGRLGNQSKTTVMCVCCNVPLHVGKPPQYLPNSNGPYPRSCWDIWHSYPILLFGVPPNEQQWDATIEMAENEGALLGLADSKSAFSEEREAAIQLSQAGMKPPGALTSMERHALERDDEGRDLPEAKKRKKSVPPRKAITQGGAGNHTQKADELQQVAGEMEMPGDGMLVHHVPMEESMDKTVLHGGGNGPPGGAPGGPPGNGSTAHGIGGLAQPGHMMTSSNKAAEGK
eukprot:CAMPEP_0177643948 /NCGR_PEP_ID=MMETSP0447-20121125/8421_1 /TAXON_ID=0 /ORGANISM="Stygamoeba regulata, Strain BSH-02190019" /LENGTH=373 /DNA_ID=CAMNT_0019146265 /DNA_START=70 /DNA_END=1191 /DNA_ORIENTATION=-